MGSTMSDTHGQKVRSLSSHFRKLSAKISQPKKQNNRITIPGTNSTFSLEEIKAAAAKQHDATSPDENFSSIHSWNDPNFGGDDWLKPEDIANMIQNQSIPKKKKHSHKKKFGYENITKPINELDRFW